MSGRCSTGAKSAVPAAGQASEEETRWANVLQVKHLSSPQKLCRKTWASADCSLFSTEAGAWRKSQEATAVGRPWSTGTRLRPAGPLSHWRGPIVSLHVGVTSLLPCAQVVAAASEFASKPRALAMDVDSPGAPAAQVIIAPCDTLKPDKLQGRV